MTLLSVAALPMRRPSRSSPSKARATRAADSSQFGGQNPIDFEMDYQDALDWYGVPAAFQRDVFDCSGAARLDGTENSDLCPFFKQTEDLGRFKEFIGLPDSYLRSGKAIAPESSELEYSERFADPQLELTETEMLTVMQATGSYLFGDSRAVARFRRAIELRMAPFQIAVYAARKVILRPTASLTISGLPAVVITKEIDIQPGASIQTLTVTRILSDRLSKGKH